MFRLIRDFRMNGAVMGRGWLAVSVSCVFLLTSCGVFGSDDSVADPAILALAERPGLNEFQVDLLSDGVLTFAEYEQAVFRAVKCTEDLGFEDVTPELVAGEFNTRVYEILSTYPENQDVEVLAVLQEECQDDSLSAVEEAYTLANEPSVEELEEYDAGLNDCEREILIETGEYTAVDVEILTDELSDKAWDIDFDRMKACALQLSGVS